MSPTPLADHLVDPIDTRALERGEDMQDAPASTSTPYQIDAGDTFEGSITAGDVDYIQTFLTAGQTYEFGLVGSGSEELGDPLLELRDSSGNLVQSNDDFLPGVTASAIIFTPTSSDDYYLTVQSADGGTGGYFLGVIPDSPGARNTTNPLGRFERQEAIMQPGETDAWRVSNYSEGLRYSISVTGLGDAGLEEARIRLYENGTDLVDSVRSATVGGTATIDFLATDADYYTITVEGRSNSDAGVYEIRSLADPVGNLDADWFISPEFYYTGALSPNDSDWFFIDLEAGKTYGAEMFARGDSEVDPFVTVLDQDGNIIVENDNETDDPEDTLNAYASFTATYTGRYFIAYDNTNDGDPGIYGFSVQNLTDASPIDAITWRDATLPTDDAITVFFANAGEVVNETGAFVDSLGFTGEERQEMMSILRGVSNFADIQFVQTRDQDNADFQIARNDLTELSDTLIGRANPLGSTFYSDGVIILDDDYWDAPNLQRGGFMNHVIAHEFGHALGLAHPHDYGGDSRPFVGVRDSDQLGDFDLNQVPFTAMSYNDYWNGHALEESDDKGTGYLWGFGSLDIIALQQQYGANMSFRASNSDYTIGKNAWLETIWDTGGLDRIKYGGDADAVIDLRAATGEYSDIGGGAVSFAQDSHSGFVIAQGVEIERAFGGRGSDTITGNDGDNKLDGRNGADFVQGGAGADMVLGGLGSDELYGGVGNDIMQGGKGDDLLFGNRNDDVMYGNAFRDTLDGGGGNDQLYGGQHNDTLIGGNGNDRLDGGTGNDLFQFDMSDGTDEVVNFDETDWIDLRGLGLQYSDLTIDLTDGSESVRFGSTVLNFTGLTADLGSDDFLF